MWWIYALLSAFFASLTAILAKVGVRNVDPDLATAIRTAVVLCLTWGIVLFKPGSISFNTLTKNNLIFLVLSGVATGMSWLFYFRALQAGNVSQVAPIDKLSVALTIILSVVFLHESISLKVGLGAALIVVGVLLVI